MKRKALLMIGVAVAGFLSQGFTRGEYPQVSQSAGNPCSGNDYPINFDADLAIIRTDRYLSRITLTSTSGGATTVICDGPRSTVYQDKTAYVVPARAGDEISSAVTYTGEAMDMYLYIDFDQDGRFDSSLNADGTPAPSGELVSYTYYDGVNSEGTAVSSITLDSVPTFTLPEHLPHGVYRARFKIDRDNIDPGGNYCETGSDRINDNGGAIIDFLINVLAENHTLVTNVGHGSVNDGTSLTSTIGIAERTTPYTPLSVRFTPIESTYTCDSVTIRHGHTDKERYIHGNRQWGEYKVKYSETITIPADSVSGDLFITAAFVPASDSKYWPVFSDEFDDLDNGSLPNTKVWSHTKRGSSAWDRYMATTEEERELTGYIEDGKFIARTLPNPYLLTDEVPMISGGITTAGHYTFTYGKIEARILTYPHTGNFPAFWMMPSDRYPWPYGGEIDIWEQIDNSDTSWHTIHSEWSNVLGNSDHPAKSGGNTPSTAGKWHTFTLQWDKDLLTWYVDGKEVFSYAKSTDEDALAQGQWPFDKAFYIILNQSVGIGSWAAEPDTTHTYVTKFDWVRVYQTAEQNPAAVHGAMASNKVCE